MLALIDRSRLEAIAEHQQRNDRTHCLLTTTEDDMADELRKGSRPDVHFLLFRLPVDAVSNSLECQRHGLIQIVRQRRRWHILCTVNPNSESNTKRLVWESLDVGYQRRNGTLVIQRLIDQFLAGIRFLLSYDRA